MDDVREALARHSLKRPSARVVVALDPWLLPDEPVVAAINGYIRNQPAWFLVTQSVVVGVRDGMKPSVEFCIVASEVAGYQQTLRWGSIGLELSSAHGSVVLDQVQDRAVAPFVHGLQATIENLAPSGTPPPISSVAAKIDALAGSIDAARESGLAIPGDERPSLDIAVDELAIPFVQAIGDPMLATYPDSLLIWMLASMYGIDGPRLHAVREFFTYASTSAPIKSSVMDAARESEGQAWNPSLLAASSMFKDAAQLPTSAIARKILRDRSEDLRRLVKNVTPAKPDTSPQKPQESDMDRTVKHLERLRDLHESGAIDGDEFALLKQRLLGSGSN